MSGARWPWGMACWTSDRERGEAGQCTHGGGALGAGGPLVRLPREHLASWCPAYLLCAPALVNHIQRSCSIALRLRHADFIVPVPVYAFEQLLQVVMLLCRRLAGLGERRTRQAAQQQPYGQQGRSKRGKTHDRFSMANATENARVGRPKCAHYGAIGLHVATCRQGAIPPLGAGALRGHCKQSRSLH